MNIFNDLNNAMDPAQVIASIEKYRMYSAHDTQVTNVLYQLNPNYNFTYIKYAANFIFELHQID